MPRLADSHCHLHSTDYPEGKEVVLERAHAAGVDKIICIGTSVEDSKVALEFAEAHEGVYATVGVHPHEVRQLPDGKDAKDGLSAIISEHLSSPGYFSRLDFGIVRKPGAGLPKSRDKIPLRERACEGMIADSRIVAIGEVGLDYHYKPYDKEAQIELFETQLQLARDLGLPVVFHVREAYEDFWPVVDNFPGIQGVLHSFSDNLENLSKGLARGFYVGLNGIATYKKTPEQAEAFAGIPLERMLLETDAPYLTPSAKRGIMNEPTYVGLVLEWVAKHCGKSPEEVATTTTRNTEELFKLHERARESSSGTDTGPTGTYRRTSAA